MKKMLLATALACLLQDVLNRRLLFKNKPAAVAPKETITHHSSFLELGGLSMQPKFVAAQKMFVKTETQQTFINGLLETYFEHLCSAGSACVLLPIIA